MTTPEEITIHGGVVRVIDAHVLEGSRYNRIKAENQIRHLSVHYQIDGINSPGPRDALLVSIVSGIQPEWLKNTGVDEAGPPVSIDFLAVSAEACTDKPYNVGKQRPAIKSESARIDEDDSQFDMLHMSTIQRGSTTRLHLTMTDESSHKLHASVVMSKGQVTQMIAHLLVLYQRLNEN